MKSNVYNIGMRLAVTSFLMLGLAISANPVSAQEDSTVKDEVPVKAKPKPVKNTFQSVWIIDNQTVMVPVKGTLEMDIMHRFGTVNKGYEDFFGVFAPSNIRLGLSYAPINNLFIGVGLTKSNMLLDGNAKYSIIKQTKGLYPVSVTYYGNMAYDTRKDKDGSIFRYGSQRLSFFNQLIIARKITEKLSLQIAPSISHQNSVNGYYTKNDSSGQTIFKEMKHTHFAISFAGRYKITEAMAIMVNYDQPVTRHETHNPNPNIALGIEFSTSGHSFQLFFGNYYYLNPQRNNLFNTNSPFRYDDMTKTHPDREVDNPNTTADESVRVKGGRFVIGFNITRIWNY